MNTIYVSVEGLDADLWRTTFEAALRGSADGGDFSIFTPGLPGAAAGSRGNQAGVRYAPQPGDDPWKKAGVIIQALALAASLALGPKPPSPVPPEAEHSALTCVIQGEGGTTTLKLDGGKVDENLLRTCLEKTGPPKHISVKPAPSPGSHHPAAAKTVAKKPVKPVTPCE